MSVRSWPPEQTSGLPLPGGDDTHLPHMIELGRIPVDVALIQVSPPDEFGYVSLGVSVDMLQAAVARAKYVVAEINPYMPRTMGDSTLHIDEIDRVVPVDTPVIEYKHAAAREDTVERIARYIASPARLPFSTHDLMRHYPELDA